MAKKRQHFVPQVYMKAWETEFEKISEPKKKFRGVYVFKGESIVGNGSSRKAILWEPRLYTIGYDYLNITNSCPKVRKYFEEQIYEIMNTNKPKIYGRLGSSKIQTKKSIGKHLDYISSWDFFYYDGKPAKKKSIINRIKSLNCNILEDAFAETYENGWEIIYNRFIKNVQMGIPISEDSSERVISMESVIEILKFFFMMLCRNPQFDMLGVFTRLKQIIPQSLSSDNNYAEKRILSQWYSELYKMFFKKNVGFFHHGITRVIENCQMVLFEAYDNEGTFITSDNPAFQHISLVSIKNSNGFIFPISPKYLLFIAKGSQASINIVDHRFADRDTIKHFNRIVRSHKRNTIISSEKNIQYLI